MSSKSPEQPSSPLQRTPTPFVDTLSTVAANSKPSYNNSRYVRDRQSEILYFLTMLGITVTFGIFVTGHREAAKVFLAFFSVITVSAAVLLAIFNIISHLGEAPPLRTMHFPAGPLTNVADVFSAKPGYRYYQRQEYPERISTGYSELNPYPPYRYPGSPNTGTTALYEHFLVTVDCDPSWRFYRHFSDVMPWRKAVVEAYSDALFEEVAKSTYHWFGSRHLKTGSRNAKTTLIFELQRLNNLSFGVFAAKDGRLVLSWHRALDSFEERSTSYVEEGVALTHSILLNIVEAYQKAS